MKRAIDATPQPLEALRGRVEQWRTHRDGGRALLPEVLWEAAVEVARVEGVQATSRALRFNCYSLKARLARADSEALPQRKPEHDPTFVEVQMPSLPSPAPCAHDKTVVELVGTGGARMRIDVTGTSRVDVVGLAQAFWSRER